MQGASIASDFEGNYHNKQECLVRGRLVWDESRVLIDELAS